MTATIHTTIHTRRSAAARVGAASVAVVAGASGTCALVGAVVHSIGATGAAVPLGSGVACVIAGFITAVFTGSVRASGRTAPRPGARTHTA